MFHQDRVNRLPDQTQRRVHGCATSARRRGGGRRFKNTTTTSQRAHSVIRIDRKHPSDDPLSPISYHIASHGTHTRNASNPRPEAISGSGLLSQRCLAAWVSGHRDFGHPYRRIMSPFCLEDRA
ncbi:hypothetical protein K469DRAFT_715285 [Zopfia rhizophila CBS 207.26]|uniref:Uncharacterized protein n=1 Tax=Zopfia rhizophila CBS 207.26 TaxID=1314779 RepID=A0A6A6ER30_9PEZI|nr:hypothetical protein K469DRAFT_715285 [Zopfia rhizophila CBS 207.26]